MLKSTYPQNLIFLIGRFFTERNFIFLTAQNSLNILFMARPAQQSNPPDCDLCYSGIFKWAEGYKQASCNKTKQS